MVSKKFRFYIRGLGIGMLITALILIISHNLSSDHMTDEEVCARAAELGMVDGSNYTLAQNEDPAKTENEAKDKETDDKENVKGSDETQQDTELSEEEKKAQEEAEKKKAEEEAEQKRLEEEKKAQEEAEKKKAEVEAEKKRLEEEKKVQEEAEKKKAEEEAKKPDTPTGAVSFTVSSGQGSETISSNLYRAGLVDDAKAFDLYLENNGYSRKLRTGTYTISPGLSYSELAQILVNGNKEP
ncbi:MAG: endolytic transglycosylase MltG [Lachnospiraceae bacterium]|nr:endolytic transglycosylase MltG [Lachnospiraceae bacterium]